MYIENTYLIRNTDKPIWLSQLNNVITIETYNIISPPKPNYLKYWWVTE